MNEAAKRALRSPHTRFQYHDLHRRAGVHLVESVEGRLPRCLVLATRPGGLVARGESPGADAVTWIKCFSFFRYYEYWTRRVDVVNVHHPLFNSTAAIANAHPAAMNGIRLTEVDRTAAFGRGVKVFRERAFMYGIKDETLLLPPPDGASEHLVAPGTAGGA